MNQKSATHHLSSTIPIESEEPILKNSAVIQQKQRNRRLLSAHNNKSQKKLSNDQRKHNQSSNLSLMNRDNKASFRDISQGYDQRNNTPSEGLFDDDKLVQQVFVRHSLTLNNNSSYYSPVKQQSQKDICEQALIKYNSSQQKIEQISVKLSRDNTKEGSFATLEGKKATEIVNQSLSNSIGIELKVQNGNKIDNKNLQYSIKPTNVIEVYKIQEGLRKQENKREQDPTSQLLENTQSLGISKVKNQCFGIISNLLDQQKAKVRQHRYSQSQETSHQVQGRSNQIIIPDVTENKQMENSSKTQGEQILKQNFILEQPHQTFYKEEMQSSQVNQRKQISNNYREYLKNKLQYNYPNQQQQQIDASENDQQRILKGGIIVGKQVQRARKNTSYGKGISVFENLLQRKQQQLKTNSNSGNQDQKNLSGNINKQSQSTFTQSFYQNLIKQSKRLNNLINQQETDWNRKQRYINTQTKQYQQNQEGQQQNFDDTTIESKQDTLDQANNAQFNQNQLYTNSKKNFQLSTQDLQDTLLSCTFESLQNSSEKDFATEENKQEFCEKYQNPETIRNQGRIVNQFNGITNLGNNERPSSSQTQNQSKNNLNGLYQTQTSPEQSFLYNFKKRQNLHINSELNQIQQELNSSALSISSNFTDKVIKHFRFASTMKNSDYRHPLSSRKERNPQFSFNTDNYLVIQDQRDENCVDNQHQNTPSNQKKQYQTQQEFYKQIKEQQDEQIINQNSNYPLTSRASNLLTKNYQINSKKEIDNNQNHQIPLKQSNNQLINQKGLQNIYNANRGFSISTHNSNYQQDKRRSLQLDNSKGFMQMKNNQSNYSISPEKRGQPNSSNSNNKKIQNYVSELVNKQSLHSRINEECGPWVGEEEDEADVQP